MRTPILQLFAPEVVEIQRARAGSIAVGDYAHVRLQPGIFALLMNPVAGSPVPLGKDLHPMTTVPAGIAIDAATEACGYQQTGVGTLRALEFSMDNAVTTRDTLDAWARVSEVGVHHVTVAVEVYEQTAPELPPTGEPDRPGRRILHGQAILVRVEGGRAGPVPQ